MKTKINNQKATICSTDNKIHTNRSNSNDKHYTNAQKVDKTKVVAFNNTLWLEQGLDPKGHLTKDFQLVLKKSLCDHAVHGYSRWGLAVWFSVCVAAEWCVLKQVSEEVNRKSPSTTFNLLHWRSAPQYTMLQTGRWEYHNTSWSYTGTVV